MPATLTRTLKEGMRGKDVQAVRRACLKFNGEPASSLTTAEQRTFGPGMTQLVKRAQDQAAMSKSGVVGPKLMGALRRAGSFDLYGEQLLEQYAQEHPKKKVPALGPVQPGGVSLLNMSLTHPTSSIPLFPAVDTAWGGGGGVTVIAPEDCVVDTKDTSSSPGEAVYLKGLSTLRFWIGHLNRDWPLGHRFKKGDEIGTTLPIPGQSDHAHWGVNAEALLGKGKELLWGRTGNGPPYTLGAPTVGAQLRKWAKA